MYPSPLSWRALGLSLFTVGALFVAAEYLTAHFQEAIRASLGNHTMFGMLVFTSTTVLATILPFFSNLPLIPLATLLFGPFLTTGLLVVGWVLGSGLSFAFARGYQTWLFRRFPLLVRYSFVDTLIAPDHPFLSLIILRMTFPVDILSYALGTFSRQVSWRVNLQTTLIGVTPFAFLFGYFGALSPAAQTTVFVLSTIGFVAYLSYLHHLRRNITPLGSQPLE